MPSPYSSPPYASPTNATRELQSRRCIVTFINVNKHHLLYGFRKISYLSSVRNSISNKTQLHSAMGASIWLNYTSASYATFKTTGSSEVGWNQNNWEHGKNYIRMGKIDLKGYQTRNSNSGTRASLEFQLDDHRLHDLHWVPSCCERGITHRCSEHAR